MPELGESLPDLSFMGAPHSSAQVRVACRLIIRKLPHVGQGYCR